GRAVGVPTPRDSLSLIDPLGAHPLARLLHLLLALALAARPYLGGEERRADRAELGEHVADDALGAPGQGARSDAAPAGGEELAHDLVRRRTPARVDVERLPGSEADGRERFLGPRDLPGVHGSARSLVRRGGRGGRQRRQACDHTRYGGVA